MLINKKHNSYIDLFLPDLQNIAIKVLFIFLTAVSFGSAYAQSPLPPPSRLQVYPMQDLSFGSFSVSGSGGTVIVSPDGNRYVSGSVVSFDIISGSSAIFDVRLVPGRLIHISFPESATLTRSGSGETMIVRDFISDKNGNYFVTDKAHPFLNSVFIGATLYVGAISANPPGDYNGSFPVIFIQE